MHENIVGLSARADHATSVQVAQSVSKLERPTKDLHRGPRKAKLAQAHALARFGYCKVAGLAEGRIVEEINYWHEIKGGRGASPSKWGPG